MLWGFPTLIPAANNVQGDKVEATFEKVLEDLDLERLKDVRVKDLMDTKFETAEGSISVQELMED